jgi:hypothetical protein
MLLLCIVLLLLAFQKAQAGPPFVNVALLIYYDTANCTGNVVHTEVSPGDASCFLTGGYDQQYINGQLLTVPYNQLNCPVKTFGFGVSACDNTVPISAVCIVDPSMKDSSFKLACTPEICKPQPNLPKTMCDKRATQCNSYFQPMKW